MTRETKVGLLVGLGIILLIGIIVSDHLSVVQTQTTPELTGFAPDSQQAIETRTTGRANTSTDPGRSAEAGGPTDNGLAGGPTGAGGVDSGGLPVANVGSNSPTVGGAGVGADSGDVGRQQPIPMPGEPGPGEQGYQLPGTREAWRVGEQIDPNGAGRNGQSQRLTGANTGGDTDSGADQRATQGSTTVLPAPSGQLQPVIHYVQPGDRLWTIAKRYYGDGKYWPAIKAANPTAIPADNTLRPNVRLIVPNKATVVPAADNGNAKEANAARDPIAELRHDLVRNEGRDEGRNEGHGELGAAPPGSGAGRVKVEAGDTLSQLAERHLGSSRLWNELFKANRDQLTKPEDLRPGMVLRVPQNVQAPAEPRAASSSGAGGASSAGSATRSPASRPGVRTYKVRAGDTLLGIAERTLGDRADWRLIYKANAEQISNPDKVEAGLTLVIPAKTTSH